MVTHESSSSQTIRQRTSKAAASATVVSDKKEVTKEDVTGKTKAKTQKKRLPSVQEMLIHGAPESRGRKKTFLEIVLPAVALAIVFAISLAIFHMAPHVKSKGKTHRLPRNINGGGGGGNNMVMKPLDDEPLVEQASVEEKEERNF